jgi:putative Holliday junction resolvase
MTRCLGLDFGDKTTGVAVSDPLGWTARGLEVIRRKNPLDISRTIERIAELAEEYGVKSIILGDPKGLDGGPGVRFSETARFQKALSKLGFVVIKRDERFSTAAVTKIFSETGVFGGRRENAVDMAAAAYILQGYLDEERGKQTNNREVGLMQGEEIFDGDDVETIIMSGENGEEVEYLILDEVEYEGDKYILVVEADAVDDDESDAVLFKQVGESEEDYVYEVPGDDEFEAVAKILSERLDEYEIES